MCGIAGFCNMPEGWQENIKRMNERMKHRGPEVEGIWSNEDASVVFGHRRLSIVDLSPTGAQPMVSASERYVITLNGEIYNYKTIAKKLLDEGKVIAFRGHSDTEVLLEAFEAYGFKNTLAMTKGMFAIALYDRKEKKLYLGRDRIGEKPLYYGIHKGCFLFASDIVSIRENSYFTPEIDKNALALYFRYGYIPAPYTIYTDIKKMEAGSILELDYPFKTIKEDKYWDIMDVAKRGQENLFQGTEQEAADELEHLLRASIQGQMVADVPVGAFLSGGIDSTAVTAIMQSLANNKVKTFSIGFEDQEYNEAQYAKETAKYLGTDHTELYVTDKEAMSVIPKLPYIYGEPFADSSQIPTYLVSKLARKDVTVALSGDGGDELFCGYNSYRIVENIWNKIKPIPLPLRRAFGKTESLGIMKNMGKIQLISHYIAAKSAEELYMLTGNFNPGTDQIVIGGKIPDFKFAQYPHGFFQNNIPNNIMLMDLQMYHPDDILVKVDRSGMAVSLESRVPMLDKDIVEFSWTLPLIYNYDGNIGKKTLRNVLYRYVPEAMMDRPKKGFSIPVMDWVRTGELKEWAAELLKEEHIRNQGILDPKVVTTLWNRFLKTGHGRNQIWYLLMFEAWCM